MPTPNLSVIESRPLRYVLSVPPTPAPDRLPPLLCFLHGYDEAAPMPIERAMTLRGPLTPTAARLACERFVIVAPQLPRAGDLWDRYADAVAEVVDAARAATGADPARTCLTGFSFGGNGVFDLALAMPGRWTALWAVDPTRLPPSDPDPPIWLSVGERARPLAGHFVRALGLRPAGAAEQPAPEGPRVYTDEGLDHVETDRSAYGSERIYHWILTHAAGVGG